jgi:hypothetical protein
MSFVLLGILNAQAAAAGGAGAYDLLETTILDSDASSVEFTGLDAYTDYKHLQIRAVARTDRASAGAILQLRFNADSGSNYARHSLTGDGSAVTSFGVANDSKTDLARVAAASSVADAFGSLVADILDFSSASKNTTLKSFNAGFGAPGSLYLSSGGYFITDPITSLEIFDADANNIVSGSRFSLYGIRGE